MNTETDAKMVNLMKRVTVFRENAFPATTLIIIQEHAHHGKVHVLMVVVSMTSIIDISLINVIPIAVTTAMSLTTT